MNRDVQVWTIKDNYRLGSDINSKVLAFAFGLSAEIERNLISQRTKEALARKRAEGVVLGRPKGSKSKVKKLTGKEAEIKTLLDKKISKSAIARILGVHRLTVAELQTHLVQKLISFNNWLFGKNYYFLLMGIMMTNKMAVCKSCANKKQIRQLLLLQLPDFHLCPRRT